VKIGIPRCLPFFFASLKVAITLAFVGTTVSEMSASNEGIGYLLISAGSSMRLPLAFAGLVAIGIMAMSMYEIFAVIERKKLHGQTVHNPMICSSNNAKAG
jgi:NitT/TauT family transport system permease protein